MCCENYNMACDIAFKDKRNRIQVVSVMDGIYSVTYYSGKKRMYANPPKTVRDFCSLTPFKENWECCYNGETKPFTIYRNENYRIID